MKALTAFVSVLFLSPVFAATSPTPGAASPPGASGSAHRYLIERTFPAGTLEGLDAAGKTRINQTNSRYHVHWLMSYANAEKTKTYCIYEGPSEAAVREASHANGIPVDKVTEVPVTLLPK